MIRKLFIKYLTQDSETRDARRKEFNQAIFDAQKGFANYCQTDLDMVLEKFDKALAGFCAEIENIQNYNEGDNGMYDKGFEAMRQKILNKLKEGAE